MKKRSLFIILILYSVILSGCALNIKVPTNGIFSKSEETVQEPIIEESIKDTEDVLQLSFSELLELSRENGTYSEDEIRMLELENLKDCEGLSRSEYAELAEIYEKMGYMLNARDIYEEAYKLSISDEYIEKLNEIYVNAEEENEEVREMLDTLAEYFAEAVNTSDYSKVIRLIESEEWYKTIMPFVRAGYRNYYSTSECILDLLVRTGYSNTGEHENRIYCIGKGEGKNKGIILKQDGDIISIYIEETDEELKLTDILNDNGLKTYTLIRINTLEGTVETETGNLKNGVYTGDYYASLVKGDYKSAYELYLNKDNLTGEYYKGSFDENGKSIVEKPSDNNIAAFAKAAGTDTVVVYAYNDKKNKCLYKGITKEQATAGFSFGYQEIEMEQVPTVNRYEVRDKLEVADLYSNSDARYVLETDIKIRIYNGQIQVYDGSRWTDYGAYEKYVENDPLNQASNLIKENMEVLKQESTDSPGKVTSIVGTITTPKVASAGTGNKTSSSSSKTQGTSSGSVAQAQQPVQQTVAPTVTEPTPQPSSENTTNSGSSNPEPSNPESVTPPASDPPPSNNTPSDSSAGAGGNTDTEIDYSDLYK